MLFLIKWTKQKKRELGIGEKTTVLQQKQTKLKAQIFDYGKYGHFNIFVGNTHPLQDIVSQITAKWLSHSFD